ncbi:ABC transporter permease subunit [Pandoraea sputorum]|uniref:ABC transporter permease n=1 Tax=Pandoraea sputorum TaxID=93222 RepID=A0A5E5BIA1_9BURK|nr:ABC transporter permease subunit [Pandoraea sputorum]VVE85951.1 ABC transporter permease [Pandoraea sputorum]
MNPFELAAQSLPVLLQGTVLTIKFALMSMVFGLAIGIIVAVMGIGKVRVFRAFARAYVSIMRGTPLLGSVHILTSGPNAQAREAKAR